MWCSCWIILCIFFFFQGYFTEVTPPHKAIPFQPSQVRQSFQSSEFELFSSCAFKHICLLPAVAEQSTAKCDGSYDGDYALYIYPGVCECVSSNGALLTCGGICWWDASYSDTIQKCSCWNWKETWPCNWLGLSYFLLLPFFHAAAKLKVKGTCRCEAQHTWWKTWLRLSQMMQLSRILGASCNRLVPFESRSWSLLCVRKLRDRGLSFSNPDECKQNLKFFLFIFWQF